jgi:hypothetical protein
MSHILPDPLPEEETLPVWLGDDPDMALVHADMAAYHEALICPQCDGKGTEDHSWNMSEPCIGCGGTGERRET